ncbi:MAG: hypothetical protein LBR15_09035 [Methanobrevibacter sp.]|jgi:polyhydroxyalkanoate synthesis regulator phasin|nr:hypothetical protein [Candidatus Methanovirga australis]
MELYQPNDLNQFKRYVHYNAVMFASEARKWAMYDFVLNYMPSENIQTRGVEDLYEIQVINREINELQLRGFWDKIKNAAKKVGNSVAKVAKDGFNQVKDLVKDQVNACKSAVVDLGKMTLDFGKKALNTVASSPLADLLPGGLGNLVQLANGVVNAPKEEQPQEVQEEAPINQAIPTALTEEEKAQLTPVAENINNTRKNLIKEGKITNEDFVAQMTSQLKNQGLNDLQVDFIKSKLVDDRGMNLYYPRRKYRGEYTYNKDYRYYL